MRDFARVGVEQYLHPEHLGHRLRFGSAQEKVVPHSHVFVMFNGLLLPFFIHHPLKVCREQIVASRRKLPRHQENYHSKIPRF